MVCRLRWSVPLGCFSHELKSQVWLKLWAFPLVCSVLATGRSEFVGWVLNMEALCKPLSRRSATATAQVKNLGAKTLSLAEKGKGENRWKKATLTNHQPHHLKETGKSWSPCIQELLCLALYWPQKFRCNEGMGANCNTTQHKSPFSTFPVFSGSMYSLCVFAFPP